MRAATADPLLVLRTGVKHSKAMGLDEGLVIVTDARTGCRVLWAAQVLMVHAQDAAVPDTSEAVDGITPAMRDPRRRIFRKPIDADPTHVRQVEEDILQITAVRV